MLGWCPSKANTDVMSHLGANASIQQAAELAAAYALNPATAQIWQHLIAMVKDTGSLAGMLRSTTVPLVHSGYQLPAFGDGVDLQWLGLSKEAAHILAQQLQATIHDCNVKLYGTAAIPAEPSRKLLLQCLVDLLACNYDQVKLGLAPAASPSYSSEAVAPAAVGGTPAAAGGTQAAAGGTPAAAGGTQAAAGGTLAAAGGTQAAAAAVEGLTLSRGTGLLLLLPNAWAGKGKPLIAGRAVVGSLQYSHYTVGCLTSKEGILMKRDQPQQVMIRVAQEFLADTAPAAGLWSAKSFTITVEPYATLLLAAKPVELISKRFKATTPGYMALYGEGLSQDAVSAALGKLCYEPQRPKRTLGDAATTTRPAAAEVGPALAKAYAALTDLALSTSESEAAAAQELACAEVLPILRAASSSSSSDVAVVREGIKALHAAAVTGQMAPSGTPQQVQEALQALCGISLQPSSKRHKPVAAAAATEDVLVDSLPCEHCQVSESDGDPMLVCDWCGSASAHLRCLGLSSVPADVWLCSACKEEGHRQSAQEAADLDGRWVLGRFRKRIAKPFWGQVSCIGCYGLLDLRYSDGEVYSGVRAAHLHGRESLVSHIGLELQPVGCVVPPAVLRKFRKMGWLA